MFQSLPKYFTKPPAQKKQSCITIFNLFIQIQFIFEQLELCQVKLHARRYSVNLISTSSFIWQITSSSLYQKLQDLFILSSVSSLLKLSRNSSVECCDIDMEYLRIQSNDLSESEKWLFFWMTKNRTSKQKNFVGFTDDGIAKTVLTFKIQSICSKYKDVLCVVGLPCLSLNVDQFHRWFMNVMKTLNEIFLMIAVSVDNHVVKRSFLEVRW